MYKLPILVLTSLLTASAAIAQAPVRAGIITGPAAIVDPAHTGRVVDQWVKGLGEQDLKEDNTPDTKDNDNYGLLLSKNTKTGLDTGGTPYALSHILHVDHQLASGIYGFDYKIGSQCGVFGPSFLLITVDPTGAQKDGIAHLLPCIGATTNTCNPIPLTIAAPTSSTSTTPGALPPPEDGWCRVTFDTTAHSIFGAPLLASDVVQQLYLVFAEGTDAAYTSGKDAKSSSGQAVLDNILVPQSASVISEPRK